jgi:hypothetical protein
MIQEMLSNSIVRLADTTTDTRSCPQRNRAISVNSTMWTRQGQAEKEPSRRQRPMNNLGPMKKPDDSNDLKSLDGGVMGEGGCPSRAEVKRSLRLLPKAVLTVWEYRESARKSQGNTLSNYCNASILFIIIYKHFVEVAPGRSDPSKIVTFFASLRNRIYRLSDSLMRKFRGRRGFV